jgi:tripartite-type tricarboxylate transporter receptor subunit TctC
MLACMAALLSAPDAFAQNWPTRPVKLIVPTGPGAATDVMARLLADGASRGLGQPIIVENLPGASGILARQAAARAMPDGYTFLFTNTSGMAINPISFKQLPYDPTRDFTAVALVCNLGPQMLSVNIALPVVTLAQFIAYAKANPGRLSLAYDTTAGAAGFAAKLLNKRAELGLAEVPYRSAAQMGQDIASGVTQAMMSSIAAANPFIEAGKIRRIAISSGMRFPACPIFRRSRRPSPASSWTDSLRWSRRPERPRSSSRGSITRLRSSSRARTSGKGCCCSALPRTAREHPRAPGSTSGASKSNGGDLPRSSTFSRSEDAGGAEYAAKHRSARNRERDIDLGRTRSAALYVPSITCPIAPRRISSAAVAV